MTAKVHVLRMTIVGSTAAFGIVSLAIGLSAAALVELCIVAVEIRRTLALGFRPLAAVYAKALVLAGLSALPAAGLLVSGMMSALRLPGLLLLAALSALAWLVGILVLRHPLWGEIRTLAGKARGPFRR